jgi:hypothetical protein
MDDILLTRMANDFTRREGTEMEKRPKWDGGSSLWNSPTYQVEEYINILERKIVELSGEIDKYKERDRLTELWAKGEIEN